MTSPTKFALSITLMTCLCVSSALAIDYQQQGPYRLVTEHHLIHDLPHHKDNAHQMVVEIPSGSRQKWEVNKKTGQLEWEFRDGKPREVKYLPYPGNYGFLPQTLSGDNDPLDVIVLSESVPRGALLSIKVIGMLKLSDGGEQDHKVIAVTDDGAFKKIDSLKEMLIKHPSVMSIVKQWFVGYKKPGKMVFLGYDDKKQAHKYINKAHQHWQKQQQ